MYSFTQDGELFVNQEMSDYLLEQQTTHQFNKVMINGIKIKDGYETIDEVLSMLIKRYMKDKEQNIPYNIFNIGYDTQATNEEN